MTSVLTTAQQRLRAKQRSTLQEIEVALVQQNASRADTALLRECITTLDGMFLLCIVGEFNAGTPLRSVIVRELVLLAETL